MSNEFPFTPKTPTGPEFDRCITEKLGELRQQFFKNLGTSINTTICTNFGNMVHIALHGNSKRLCCDTCSVYNTYLFYDGKLNEYYFDREQMKVIFQAMKVARIWNVGTYLSIMPSIMVDGTCHRERSCIELMKEIGIDIDAWLS